MKNVKIRPLALFLFVLFALCFVCVAFATGALVSDVWSALITAYKSIPLVLLLWAGFVAYAWKWRVFKRWLVPFPYVGGTWHGQLQTTWKDPETGHVPGPIPVILTIKQSFGRVSCVMRTAEMTSRSYCADLWLDSDEQLRKLGYCYTSVPSVTVADRSHPHDGTISLELIGDPVEKLRGTYWTTRKTTGEITLTFRCRERLEEYPADLGVHPMKDKKRGA